MLKEPLLRLAARYLAVEKRRGRALCPVANFHLRNGATLWRLNFNADTSHKGLGQSASLMVNYRYDLGQLEQNNRAYLQGCIRFSEGVRALLEQQGG